MFVIKNKYYNNKNKIKNDKINKKYLKIQKKRLSEEDRKPLNNIEKFLFAPNRIKIKCTELSNGFYKLNKVSHIIIPMPKSEIESFYNASEKFLGENPANTIMSTVISEDTKQRIIKVGECSNVVSWSDVCITSPKIKYVNFISVSIFNISIAYFGISFDIIWNDDFCKELNNTLISQVNSEYGFREIKVNGKKTISKVGNNPNIDRRRKVDDILLEYKLKTYMYLCKYYALEDCYKKMPLSLDEYVTDLNIDDKFIQSYGYFLTTKRCSFEIEVLFDNKYIKQKCYFELFEENIFGADYKINRSRLLIESKNNDDIHISFESLIPLYITMVKEYSLVDYDMLLMKKQKIINNSCNLFPTIIFGGYIDYLRITKQTNSINAILKDDNIDYGLLLGFNFNFYDNEIKKMYNIYDKREKELDMQINNILNLRNSRFTLYIAIISLLVAIVAIVVSILISK